MNVNVTNLIEDSNGTEIEETTVENFNSTEVLLSLFSFPIDGECELETLGILNNFKSCR